MLFMGLLLILKKKIYIQFGNIAMSAQKMRYLNISKISWGPASDRETVKVKFKVSARAPNIPALAPQSHNQV